MAIGLIIIGDEILSGKRADKHFAKMIELLAVRGLQLAWAEYLGDEPARITSVLKRTLAGDDIVFCCGGIGATPDDHTRQCAAAALGVPLVLHPEAKTRIQ
jgi:molybdopterin-biosynthesis enzyme MoeA-like protein